MQKPDQLSWDSTVVSRLLYFSLVYSIFYSIFNYFQNFIDAWPFVTMVIYSAFILALIILRRFVSQLLVLVLFFFSVLAAVTALAVELGTASNIHFYFLSILLGAAFLFRGYRALTILGTIIPLSLFLLIHMGNFQGLSLKQKQYFAENPGLSNANLIGTAIFLAPELILLALYINDLIHKIIQSEKESWDLLANLIPESIISTYQRQNNFYAEQKDNAIVIFIDIVNFTDLCLRNEASEIVTLLHQIFSGLDDLALKCGIEKIKTIGDCYMGAANVLEQDKNAFSNCAKFAIAAQNYSRTLPGSIRFRIGIASGKLIAGAIGKKRIFFDVWGNAVNLAARLQHSGEAGTIVCSEEFYAATRHVCQYSEPQAIEAKGIGSVFGYILHAMPEAPENGV